MIKTFINLDSTTITPALHNQIRTSNSFLSTVEGNLYLFEFSDVVFSHALLLMGQNPNRFGYDLSHYINSTIFFFKNLNASPFIVLATGSSDFKRRASEDLGVGLSSLFMVKSFGLQWETISQIPQNKKIAKLTPDFLGFDKPGNRFIYESKGTTQPDKIETTMNKALAQAKGYPLTTSQKMSIVSYFPSGTKSFPSYTFVADPPAPIINIFPPDISHSTMLHYLKVLDYSGFKNTTNIYRDLLRVQFKFDLKGDEEGPYGFDSDRIEADNLREQAVTSFNNELQTQTQFEWHRRTFYGRNITTRIGELPVNIFMGVEPNYVYNGLKSHSEITSAENEFQEGATESVSTFSDGTVFRISTNP